MTAHARDPPHDIEVVAAGAGGEFADLGDVAVGSVGVGAVLEQEVRLHGAPCRQRLGGEAVARVPALGEGCVRADEATCLASGRVVGEPQLPVRDPELGRSPGGVVRPSRSDAARGAAPGTPSESVVGVRGRAAVDGFGENTAERVALYGEVGIRVGGVREVTVRTVRVPRDGARVVCLLRHPAECVPGEAQRLPGAVGAGQQTARGVVRVGEGTTVEVGLRRRAVSRVVGVRPGQPLRVGDAGQP